MKVEMESGNCPCFSGRALNDCCGPYLSGKATAPTAEALMRSRYAAFATHNMDYLEATLAPEKRPEFNREASRQWSVESEWTGLEILSTKEGQKTDTKGVVEFEAYFRNQGQALKLHAVSRFAQKDGVWYYVDDLRASQSAASNHAGRNAPCPCGSGKKFKKCCGR